MSADLPASTMKVQETLNRLGMPFRVVAMPETTRTAAEAARAIGCSVGQIAKSIVFRGAATNKPVLVVASGANRVDEKALAKLSGESLEKASADFVREATSFAIGGVPPVGFPTPIETWIDEDLLKFGQVWAAAGTPFTVFSLDPSALAAMTSGTVTRIR